jgi:hypothetical protein
LTVGLVAIGLLSFVASALYCTHVHPEVTFFREAWRVKHAWATRPEIAGQPRAIIAGGSSAAFGVIPRRIESRFGVPVVNMGLHAGLGPGLLLRVARREVQPGDTLVVALEPGLLAQGWEAPALGIQFALSAGLRDALSDPVEARPASDLVPQLLSLRPGAGHTLVLLGRLSLRQPLSRYRPADLSDDGWVQTPLRWAVNPVKAGGWRLSLDSRKELGALAEWCRTNQVKLVYALPWGYTSPREAANLREANRQMLREIAGTCPVIAGPALGVVTDPARFLDSEWHLDPVGAEARSDELGEALRSRRFLSADEVSVLGEVPGGG